MNLNTWLAYLSCWSYLLLIIFILNSIQLTTVLATPDNVRLKNEIYADKPSLNGPRIIGNVASSIEIKRQQKSNEIFHLEYDNENDEEPSDYEILLAIKNSLDEWSNNRKKQEKQHALKSPNINGTQRIRKRRDEESQVCYEHFGCFRHKGPFDYLNTLPASPESIGTTFTLYTRRNRAEGEPLDYNDETNLVRSNSTFNSTNDIKIIIHGFGSSSKRPWVMKMTEVLLELDDFNVISVDWQNGSKLPNYVQAAANTQLIGKQIAKLIGKIERLHNVPPSQYHLIGFSLGAHVAGFTGKEITNISRITGLDPASPLFEGYPPNVRLDPVDAQFVDVIHSNGDGFIRGGLGSYEPMGSVDFYPNGGRVQVGCSSALGVLTNIFYHGQWNLLCNHRRAFRFFIDSVHNDCTFRAFSCASYEEYVKGQCFDCGQDGRKCSNMGYYSHLSQGRGPMYLVTRDKEPFCVNQFRVQIHFGMKQGVTWGQIELQLINVDGLNETFTLTQEVDQLKESERIQALIVAHPKLTNISEVILTYTRYKGWIYYGQNEWNVDRIELLDSNFVIKTYCRPQTILQNTVPVRLKLLSTNCTIEFEDYYDQNIENDYDHNSIISSNNGIVASELVTPSIIDANAATITMAQSETSITPSATVVHYNYPPRTYYGQSLYSYMVPSPTASHNGQLIRSGLQHRLNAGQVVYDYESPTMTTTIGPKSELPLLELLEQKQTSSLKNLYRIERMRGSLPKSRSQLLKRPYVNENMESSIRSTLLSIPSKYEQQNQNVHQNWEPRSMHQNMQPRARRANSKNLPENTGVVDVIHKANVNSKLPSTDLVNEIKITPLEPAGQYQQNTFAKTQPYYQTILQSQQASIITPLINGASKIFWKIWMNFNNINSTTSSNSSTSGDQRNSTSNKYLPAELNSNNDGVNSSGGLGDSIVSSESILMTKTIATETAAMFRPPGFMYATINPAMNVDRIFVLADQKRDNFGEGAKLLANYNKGNQQQDSNKNNQEGGINNDDDDGGDDNNKKWHSSTTQHSFLLYSINPISSPSYYDSSNSAIILPPLQPVHLIDPYRINNVLATTRLLDEQQKKIIISY